MRAMAIFMLEAGIITRVWRAMMALRMRVSMSAMGSVMFMLAGPPGLAALRLPARLGHAGKLATDGPLAEADAAEAELAHVGAGAAADIAAVVPLDLELGLAPGLDDHRSLCHRCPLQGERPGFGADWCAGFRALCPALADTAIYRATRAVWAARGTLRRTGSGRVGSAG